jgi:hypothetical protein
MRMELMAMTSRGGKNSFTMKPTPNGRLLVQLSEMASLMESLCDIMCSRDCVSRSYRWSSQEDQDGD